MAERRYLSQEEMQKEELRLLDLFDRLCREHGLRYSLEYGTVIGAVRHKGFIPWDDDIDLSMPRPDYDKLVSLASEFDCEDACLEGYFGMPLDCAALMRFVSKRVGVEQRS